MKTALVLSLLVATLSGCGSFGAVAEREETKCIATRTLDADGKVVVLETCTGTSVRQGYPTFKGSGVNQQW